MQSKMERTDVKEEESTVNKKEKKEVEITAEGV